MNPEQNVRAAAFRSNGAWRWHFDWCMTTEEKDAFDQWLVDCSDPLAYQAGTQEWRFSMKVKEYRS